MTGLAIDIRCKAFEGAPVLEALRLTVGEGEIVAVVGPSGAGKTTLLRLIAGLDSDYEGTIRRPGGVGGPQSRIGMVFQDPRLMPWLTVVENLRLVLTTHAAAQLGPEELLREVGLGQWRDAWPRQLSGGMQRRVALARAFVIQPELLLLDEPFTSLDGPTASQLRGLLLALWARWGSTVVLVTHNLDEALALADRICFLSAPPATVLTELPLAAPRHAISERRRAFEALARHNPGLLSGAVGAADARPQGG